MSVLVLNDQICVCVLIHTMHFSPSSGASVVIFRMSVFLFAKKPPAGLKESHTYKVQNKKNKVKRLPNNVR